MSFTSVRTSPTFTSFTQGGGSAVGAAFSGPGSGADGSLLIAFVESATGGTPFKCSGNLLPTANDLGASALTGSGTFAAGTYFWKITFTTASGETQPSNEATATIALNGRASLTWTQARPGCTGVNVYRGTATGAEDHLITTLSGTATSYTDTGTTGSATSPPTNNNALTDGFNKQPGWEWIATVTPGSGHQSEIWAYRMAPGYNGGVLFTNANNAAARAVVVEFSSTLRYQTVELFPGINSANAAATSFPASMQSQTGAGELAIAAFGLKFSVNPTGQSWTTPSGWTLVSSQANSIAQPWAVYYKTTTGVGAVSVNGLYSSSANMTSWDSILCVFRESDDVRGRIGNSGTNGNTYNDQASFGLPATRKGSLAEFDHFMSVASPAKTRVMAQSAACVYQTVEGASVTSIPGDMQDYGDLGAQFIWSMKPTRNTSGATLTAEKNKFDANLAFVKQAGYFCWYAALWNEFNLGGATGPFGDDTYKKGSDPYGTGNTDATAKAHFLTYWSQFQPLLAAHGIPSATVPSLSSAPSTSSWQPPAGTISAVFVHNYANTGVSQGKYVEQSPQSGVPALTDICDGLRNPDNSVPNPPNPPIPLGVGETGRNGGSTIYAWSSVVSWSHTSTNTGHFRDMFAKRIAIRTFSTASVTNGSATLADSGNSFTNDDIGHPVRTANVPWNTIIKSITDSGHAVMSNAATATSGPQSCTITGKQNSLILWFQNNIGGPNWIHTPGIVVNGVAEDQTGIQKEIAAWQDNLAPLPPSGAATLSVTTTTLPAGQAGTPY